MLSKWRRLTTENIYLLCKININFQDHNMFLSSLRCRLVSKYHAHFVTCTHTFYSGHLDGTLLIAAQLATYQWTHCVITTNTGAITPRHGSSSRVPFPDKPHTWNRTTHTNANTSNCIIYGHIPNHLPPNQSSTSPARCSNFVHTF